MTLTKRGMFAKRTVGVRLDIPELEKLIALAANEDSTPSEAARKIICAGLNPDQKMHPLSELLRVALVEIKRLREEQAVGVEGILVATGRVSKEDASRWVSKVFKAS